MNPYETSQTQLDPNRSPVAQNPMINSSTVIAPVIQIGQPPAQSNESVLQMMQMMQMQQMMQMMQQQKIGQTDKHYCQHQQQQPKHQYKHQHKQ